MKDADWRMRSFGVVSQSMNHRRSRGKVCDTAEIQKATTEGGSDSTGGGVGGGNSDDGGGGGVDSDDQEEASALGSIIERQIDEANDFSPSWQLFRW